MAHLVKRIETPITAPIPVSSVLTQLKTAHQYLVQLGVVALQSANGTDVTDLWGTQMKRVKIVFPSGERPALVSTDHEDHSLTEVINQCATMERLIDALGWAIDNLPDYHLVRCHPTTSSQKGDESTIPDNDIVLVNPSGQLALFEVSDVSSTNDGNRKEFKDLRSLGVRLVNMDDYPPEQNPYINRLFMVVSEEFGERFRNRIKRKYYSKNQPYFRYQEHEVDGQTCIFEVLAR